MNNFNRSYNSSYQPDERYYSERRAAREAHREEQREHEEKVSRLKKVIGAGAAAIFAVTMVTGGADAIANAYKKTQPVEEVATERVKVHSGDTAWDYAKAAKQDIHDYNEEHPDNPVRGNASLDIIRTNIQNDNPDKNIGELQPGDTLIIPDYTPNESD